MKYFWSALFFFLFLSHGQAQFFETDNSNSQFTDPISWEASVEKENDSIYTLIFIAQLDQGWHLYSQKEAEIDIAPIPTAFTYNDSPETFELLGKTEEPDAEPVYDEVFEADITFFEGEVVFKQKVKVINP